jgi:hypothetical protein
MVIRLKCSSALAELMYHISQVIAWIYLYYLTVTNFGNLIALIKVPWFLAVAVTFHATGGALVQV